METEGIKIAVNKFQTPINKDLLDPLPKEVQEKFLEYVSSIEYIRRLISPERKYARDLPRDSKGRILVDLTHPHILENMDYFRPAAIHFEKYGCYTNLRPNYNHNSEFYKWISEEVRRCWEGYVRPSDGEWITGPMYYFMNYTQMELTEIHGDDKTGSRVTKFPQMWEGIYLRNHYLYQAEQAAKQAAELSARGKGKSYTISSFMSRNFTVGHSQKSSTNVKSVLVAYLKEFLTKEGTINKFTADIDFAAKYTQFPRKRLKDSQQDMTWIMGYKDAEIGVERGTKNTVLGVAIKDEVGKIRGKRAQNIFIEEFGTFPKLVSVYNVMKPSVTDGKIVFGQIYMLGTAGEDSSDFSGAQEIMYNPDGYNIYSVENIYDKMNTGKKRFVYFFPAYINWLGTYNKDGVSDVVAALISILMDRYRIKYNSTDPATITRAIAENPITPSEAIIKAGDNMFPAAYLTERLEQIDGNPKEYDDVYVGDLVFRDGKVEYKMVSKIPNREFPHKTNKIEGAIEIFKMPELDKTKKPYPGRYIAGCDPYDDDSSETMSLGSIFVLDTWTDKIVAEYTGRPMFANEFFEICRLLCLFYNARLNYENNKKGLFAYFSTMNCVYLLTENLEFLKDRDMIKETNYGNKARGVNATEPINAYARNLLRAWLLQPVTISNKNAEGKDVEVQVPNLYTLRNRALIQEMIMWNIDGNFDRVSAMGMLMLLRQDVIVRTHGNISKEEAAPDEADTDNFFKDNYKNAKNRRNPQGFKNDKEGVVWITPTFKKSV